MFRSLQSPKSRKTVKDELELQEISNHLIYVKGADLFQKGGRTKKQAAGRGTSRYSIGIKS